MKLRQHRLNIYARMHAPILENAYWQRVIDKLMLPTPEELARFRQTTEDLLAAMSLPTLSQEVANGPVVVHPFIPAQGEVLFAEEPRKVYVVKRVKDGEVVLETEDINEATALLEKHHRQKKAKLHVFCGGEPVLFVDGEAAV
jgi:hypothetical protein